MTTNDTMKGNQQKKKLGRKTFELPTQEKQKQKATRLSACREEIFLRSQDENREDKFLDVGKMDLRQIDNPDNKKGEDASSSSSQLFLRYFGLSSRFKVCFTIVLLIK